MQADRFGQTMFEAVTPTKAGFQVDNTQKTGYRRSPV